MSIAPKKVALVHVAKRQVGLEEEDYRALLLSVAGVDSAANLTEADFDQVMSELTRRGFRPRKGFGRRVGCASPAQVKLIRVLWDDYQGKQGGDAGDQALNAWLTRYHHVSALRFLTSEKAAAVLTGLKQMVARKYDGR